MSDRYPSATEIPHGARHVFLSLQGSRGPFFALLGKMLRHAGAEVWRGGFNAGDSALWC